MSHSTPPREDEQSTAWEVRDLDERRVRHLRRARARPRLPHPTPGEERHYLDTLVGAVVVAIVGLCLFILLVVALFHGLGGN